MISSCCSVYSIHRCNRVEILYRIQLTFELRMAERNEQWEYVEDETESGKGRWKNVIQKKKKGIFSRFHP